MLENSQPPHLNFGNTCYSIVITLYQAHYNTISKAFKANPLGKQLVRSRQDIQTYLPMSFTSPSRLENSQAMHPNIAYIHVYSTCIPITRYRAH